MRVNDEAIGLLPQFIKNLNRLQPEYSHGDRIWQLPMRTGARPKDWAMTHATHYRDSYYFSWTASKLSLELNAKGKAIPSAPENLSGMELKKLAWALKYFNRQVERIEKDWVGVIRRVPRRDIRAISIATRVVSCEQAVLIPFDRQRLMKIGPHCDFGVSLRHFALVGADRPRAWIWWGCMAACCPISLPNRAVH
jgi:hypothetical protein